MGNFLYIFFFFLRGEAFYPTVDTLGVQEHKDSEEAIDRMVLDVEKQWVQQCLLHHKNPPTFHAFYDQNYFLVY